MCKKSQMSLKRGFAKKKMWKVLEIYKKVKRREAMFRGKQTLKERCD